MIAWKEDIRPESIMNHETIYVLWPLSQENFPALPKGVDIRLVQIQSLAEVEIPLSNVFVPYSRIDEALKQTEDPLFSECYIVALGIPQALLPEVWETHPFFKGFVPQALILSNLIQEIKSSPIKDWKTIALPYMKSFINSIKNATFFSPEKRKIASMKYWAKTLYIIE